MFAEERGVVFAKLKNRNIIATLNNAQSDFALGGDRFWNYIENGVLYSRRINYDVNFSNFVTYKAMGLADYYVPAELFRAKVIEFYGET